MSAPSPLVPEGALQPSKGKSNLRIAFFTIVAIHVVLLGGLLIQGCKPSNKETTAKNDLPALEPLAPPATEQVQNPLPVDPTAAVVTAQPPVETVDPVAPAVVSTPAATPPPAVVATAASTPVTYIPPQLDPVTTAGEMKVHTVAKGEMLSTIAKKNKVSLKALTDANPTVNPTKLQIGQKLNIPAPAARFEAAATAAVSASAEAADVYTVKSGDALEKIARNNKTTVKAIKELNNMKTDRINVGQKLKLPGSPSSAAVETAPAPFTVPTDVASAPSPTVVR